MGSINTFYIIRHDVMGLKSKYMSYETMYDINSLENMSYGTAYDAKSIKFIEYVAVYDIKVHEKMSYAIRLVVKRLEKMSHLVTYDIISSLFICILILGI